MGPYGDASPSSTKSNEPLKQNKSFPPFGLNEGISLRNADKGLDHNSWKLESFDHISLDP